MASQKKFSTYKNILYERILNNSIKWGQGILRGSGNPAGWTIDMREEIFDPFYANIIAELFMNWVYIYRPDYVAGLATAGGFLASQISLLSHLEGCPVKALYIRKAPKSNGLQKQIEGPMKKKSTVLIVDDAINSGDSAREAIDLLLKEECIPLALVSILNFQGKGLQVLERCKIPLHYLFDLKDLSLSPSSGAKYENLYSLSWQAGPVSGGFNTAVPSSSPVAGEGKIFIGSDWGCLFSIHTDGVLDGTFPAEAPVYTDPLFKKEKIYFSASNGFFHCASIRSGEILWKIKTGDFVYTSSPIFSSDKKTIFTASGLSDGTGRLCALSEKKGDILWYYPVRGKIYGTPGVSQKCRTVITGSDDGFLYALDTGGNFRWTFETSGEIRSSVTVDDTGGYCYFASCDGFVYCLEISTGKEVWKKYLTSFDYTKGVIAGEKFLISASSGYLFCIDKKRGHILWQKCLGYWKMPSYPVVFNDRVYIGNSSGEILVFSLEEGLLLWSYHTSGAITSPPAVFSSLSPSDFSVNSFKENVFNIFNNRIYCPRNKEGFVEIYNFDFTKFLWSFKNSCIYPHKSVLLVSSNNGYLYCFIEKC